MFVYPRLRELWEWFRLQCFWGGGEVFRVSGFRLVYVPQLWEGVVEGRVGWGGGHGSDSTCGYQPRPPATTLALWPDP